MSLKHHSVLHLRRYCEDKGSRAILHVARIRNSLQLPPAAPELSVNEFGGSMPYPGANKKGPHKRGPSMYRLGFLHDILNVNGSKIVSSRCSETMG